MHRRSMIRLILAGSALLATAASGAVLDASRSAAGTFVVVTNTNNGYEPEDKEKTRNLIKSLFLKKRGDWPGGESAKPFAFRDGTPETEAFQKEVLRMSDAELSKHWLTLKQTTGDTPPRKLPSASLAVKFIAKFEGALSVMAKSDAESNEDSVKIIYEFEHGGG